METFESKRGLLAEIRRLQGLAVARKEALQDLECYVEGMLEAHAHKVKIRSHSRVLKMFWQWFASAWSVKRLSRSD